jgi:hypothetical protein
MKATTRVCGRGEAKYPENSHHDKKIWRGTGDKTRVGEEKRFLLKLTYEPKGPRVHPPKSPRRLTLVDKRTRSGSPNTLLNLTTLPVESHHSARKALLALGLGGR